MFAFQEHIIAEKEIKRVELETLFMLVNYCVIRAWPQILEKWVKHYLKMFLRKCINFRTKIENF